MGNTIVLCMQCIGIGPHLTPSAKSPGFSQVSVGTWGIFSSYGGNDSSKLVFVQRRQDSCRVTRDTSGVSSRLGSVIRPLLEVRQETQVHFLLATVISVFLSIFKKSQASSLFEALNCVCLSRCQRDMRPPVQKRRGPRAFSRISFSRIPSSGEMKDEAAFKPLQGNQPFFLVRASKYPFHLRQQIQGPSHIPVAERNLLLRCLWKFVISLQSKPRNHLSSRDDL